MNRHELENEKEWQKAEALVRESLSEKNREQWDTMELEVKRGMILEMIEEGILFWTIKGREPVRLSTLVKK